MYTNYKCNLKHAVLFTISGKRIIVIDGVISTNENKKMKERNIELGKKMKLKCDF